MSAITKEEREILKVIFSKKWKTAANAITNPKSKFYTHACTLWLGFTEGYILGKQGIKVVDG